MRRLLSKNKTGCEVSSCIASFREWATEGGGRAIYSREWLTAPPLALHKKLRKCPALNTPLEIHRVKYPVGNTPLEIPRESVFNGSLVHLNVGIGLTFLGRSCSTRQDFYFQPFFEMILAVGCR
jgi:hypothetical protein